MEYGGYLYIDSLGEEYYGTDDGVVHKLNAARYAILDAFADSKCCKLWLPVYMCHSVIEEVERTNISYCFYNIDSDFLPLLKQIRNDECILIANYYGLLSDEKYNEILCRYKNVIFDNTQAFFKKPILKNGIYNIYSPRKFFGVADGAYLISNHEIDNSHRNVGVSYVESGYLFEALEIGTNFAYKNYLKNEERISQEGPKSMSKLTAHLLSNIDYLKVKEIRQKNFKIMHNALGRYNKLEFDIFNDCVPMVYPLLCEIRGEEIREQLIKNRVYVPQWWKWVLDASESNDFEKLLSSGVMPLPIDQRYKENDMADLINIVLNIVI